MVGCTSSSKDEDQEYSSRILSKFENGMSFQKANDIFKAKGANIELFNLCNEKNEDKVTACEKGYSSIVVLPLPSDNYWLGQGDLQIYLTFNKHLTLVNLNSEIYYAKYHR